MNSILNTALRTILFLGFLFNCQLTIRLINAIPSIRDIHSLYVDALALAVFNALICLTGLIKELFL